MYRYIKIVKNLFYKIKKFIYRRYGTMFIQKPQRLLTWSKKDYEIGKAWALTQPHPNFPEDKKYTLWDYVSVHQDSTLIIHEINKKLKQ